MDTTITFRTDSETKRQASEIFDSLGMSLSTALNLFMREAIVLRRYPCSLDYELVQDMRGTYPQGFFDLFGSGEDLGFDEEPDDTLCTGEELRL